MWQWRSNPKLLSLNIVNLKGVFTRQTFGEDVLMEVSDVRLISYLQKYPSNKNERMSPEKGPFQKENSLPTIIFQGWHVGVKLMIVGWHPAEPVDKVTSGFSSPIQACELQECGLWKGSLRQFYLHFYAFLYIPKIWLFFSRWSSKNVQITPKKNIPSWKVGVLEKQKLVGFRGPQMWFWFVRRHPIRSKNEASSSGFTARRCAALFWARAAEHPLHTKVGVG